jgi:hypothetical protein
VCPNSCTVHTQPLSLLSPILDCWWALGDALASEHGAGACGPGFVPWWVLIREGWAAAGRKRTWRRA